MPVALYLRLAAATPLNEIVAFSMLYPQMLTLVPGAPDAGVKLSACTSRTLAVSFRMVWPCEMLGNQHGTATEKKNQIAVLAKARGRPFSARMTASMRPRARDFAGIGHQPLPPGSSCVR